MRISAAQSAVEIRIVHTCYPLRRRGQALLTVVL
jgi:hypothetical protein